MYSRRTLTLGAPLNSFILVMVIAFYGAGGSPSTSAEIKVEYTSMETCEAALKKNTESMKVGTIALASCTQK